MMNSDYILGVAWVMFGFFVCKSALGKIFGRLLLLVCVVGLCVCSPSIAMSAGVSAKATFQMTYSSTWLNPEQTSDATHYYGPVASVPWKTGTVDVPNANSFTFTMPLTAFTDADTGETYYLGYQEFRQNASPTGTIRTCGLLYKVPNGVRQCYVSTNFGEWSRVYDHAYGGSIIGNVFADGSSTSINAHPVLCADRAGFGPQSSVSIVIENVDVLGTLPATTQSTSLPSTGPSSQPWTGELSMVSTTMPASTQPTTQPWFEDFNRVYGFNDPSPGTLLGQAKSAASTFLDENIGIRTGANAPLFFVPTSITKPASWSVALEAFEAVQEAIFPGAKNFVGAGREHDNITDGGTHFILGVAFKGFADAITLMTPVLNWFRPLVEFAAMVAVLYLGIRRFAWALGIKDPQFLEPPTMKPVEPNDPYEYQNPLSL